MPKIYGAWSKSGWWQRADGEIIHSQYPQAIAAEMANGKYSDTHVREINLDGTPGLAPSSIDDVPSNRVTVDGKQVRPQSDKAVRFREDK